MVTLFKALADPLRLRLLDVLSRGELTVQNLTTLLGLGQSKVSHHLKILCEAGILAVKPQGTWNYYRIVEDEPLFRLIWPEIRARIDSLPQHRNDMTALVAFREQRRQQNLQFFEEHARDWDDLAQNILPTPAYLPQLLAKIPPAAELAELGVGTGSLLPEMASRCKRLVGIDHSSAMLAEAGRRLSESGHSCDLRLGELTHLPLADAELDVVLMNMVLHHLPQPGDVLKEAGRVLKPDGLIVIADLQRHQQDAVRSSMADVWLGFEKNELVDWLTGAGFSVELIETIDGHAGEYGVLLTVARIVK